MRVLVFTPYLPHARVGHGGGTAIRDMCRHLARLHELTVVSLIRPGERELVEATTAELGARLVGIPFDDAEVSGPARIALAARRGAALLRGLATGYPYYVEKYRSSALSRALIAAVEDADAEAVQIEYLQSALLTRDLRAWRDTRLARGEPAPGIFASTHELGSTPRERRAAIEPSPLRRLILKHQARAWRRLQRDATRWADRSFCVTDEDRHVLEDDGGVRCATVPLGMDTEALQPVRAPADPPRLLFVGSFGHRPNRAAAEFLIDNVWPEVAKWREDAVLDIVGRGSEEFLANRADVDHRIRAHGFVDDLTPFFRQGRLFVAPLPEGGGIKIKILEAMARGIPVATTPVGAEGIVAPEDDAAWIAPPDPRFAATVVAALEDARGSDLRAARARRIMEERFGWAGIAARLTDHYGGR